MTVPSANEVKSMAGGAIGKIWSVAPLFSLTAVALATTAILTGGGSAALAAAAASPSGITLSSFGAMELEGLTEAVGHVSNGVAWVGSHFPAAANSLVSALPASTLG